MNTNGEMYNAACPRPLIPASWHLNPVKSPFWGESLLARHCLHVLCPSSLCLSSFMAFVHSPQPYTLQDFDRSCRWPVWSKCGPISSSDAMRQQRAMWWWTAVISRCHLCLCQRGLAWSGRDWMHCGSFSKHVPDVPLSLWYIYYST